MHLGRLCPEKLTGVTEKKKEQTYRHVHRDPVIRDWLRCVLSNKEEPSCNNEGTPPVNYVQIRRMFLQVSSIRLLSYPGGRSYSFQFIHTLSKSDQQTGQFCNYLSLIQGRFCRNPGIRIIIKPHSLKTLFLFLKLSFRASSTAQALKYL